MKKRIVALRTLALLSLFALSTFAQQPSVDLRSTVNFAVLAGTAVTVTGGGSIGGNVGISPGNTWTAGTPAVSVEGTVYAGGSIPRQAQNDLVLAYNDAAGRTFSPVSLGADIGGSTLAPGLYQSTTSLAISSGDLTLDAKGDATAVWIFQIGASLTSGSGRNVILAGGANPNNIFWQVGDSATIGTHSAFQGTILAANSISLLTGATLKGRALAKTGPIQIDTGGGPSVAVPPTVTGPPAIVSEVNAASYYKTGLVAGSIASVFGSNLAVGQGAAGAGALPQTLAQSGVTIGGVTAPMYFATSGQINVQVPWEIAGQNLPPIVATVNGVASRPDYPDIVSYAPGIFTVDASGSGQGAILVGTTANLAGPGSPAARGGYIAIYCTGLGAVTNPPATGALAPLSPLSVSIVTPTVTIANVPAKVSFSGLAPGFAGLYQVNVVVPSELPPGDAVPVVMSFGSVNSNTVTIAIR
jgi:uncharacterized protein (TIGR03437 family)